MDTNVNIHFVDPITYEETPIENGILLDTKMYSIASMRTWVRRKNTVPHSRRELTDNEKDTIGCDGEISFSDDDEDNVYGDYNPGDDEDESYVVNGSLPDERGVSHTLMWNDFERFMKNIRGYFDAKEIDGLIDAVFTVCGVELLVNVRRKYLITDGDHNDIFICHIRVNDVDFCQEEIMVDDGRVDCSILKNLHDYIITRYSLMFSLISSVLK